MAKECRRRFLCHLFFKSSIIYKMSLFSLSGSKLFFDNRRSGSKILGHACFVKTQKIKRTDISSCRGWKSNFLCSRALGDVSLDLVVADVEAVFELFGFGFSILFVLISVVFHFLYVMLSFILDIRAQDHVLINVAADFFRAQVSSASVSNIFFEGFEVGVNFSGQLILMVFDFFVVIVSLLADLS